MGRAGASPEIIRDEMTLAERYFPGEGKVDEGWLRWCTVRMRRDHQWNSVCGGDEVGPSRDGDAACGVTEIARRKPQGFNPGG